MGKFLVVHPVPKDVDPETYAPLARAIKANCTTDAYWLRSWHVPEEGKLYCEWDAKDAVSVSQVMAQAAKTVPEVPAVEGIYAIGSFVSAEDYR